MLDTAEQIHFPDHVQAQVVALLTDALFAGRRLLGLAKLATGAAGDGGETVIGHVIADRLRCTQAVEDHVQFAVVLQRTLYQLVQRRVVELLPPGGFETAAVIVGRLQRGNARWFCGGSSVVRADSACRQRQGQECGGKGFHACDSCRRAALRASRFSTKARIRT